MFVDTGGANLAAPRSPTNRSPASGVERPVAEPAFAVDSRRTLQREGAAFVTHKEVDR
ncbi:hypothetical protein ACIQW4_31315 [Streptomyces albogriseolus]|uniref:hypothetical protein n=1 Tax=Streptomyces albogriseolus TaxID=1887 RepID=UPI0037FEC91F